MGKWMNRAGALSLTLAVGLVPGCGDSIEHRLTQAQIGLSHGKPDTALEMANSVLAEQPDNVDAQRYRAAALIQRAETEKARQALDELLAKHPDSIEAHRLRSDWAFARMRELLNRSEFTSDAALQASFDEAQTVGAAEVDWLEAHAKKPGEAPYLRARYALWDADRTGTILRVQRATLRREGEDPAPGTPATDPLVKQLEDERDAKRATARKHLLAALQENPAHFDAAALYAGLLKAERDWPAFWTLAQGVSEQKDLPAGLYENLVLGVVAMPESARSTEERRAVAEKLREKLVKGGADNKGAKLATAWSHLVLARDPAKAQPLVESVLRSEPNHQHGRYLMGQCLYQQGKFAEARRRLDKLATEPGMNRDPRVQLLYGMSLWKSGDPELAKEPLRRAADADPTNPAPREALMELIRATQGASGLAAIRQEVVDTYNANPGDPKAIRVRLQLEMGEGRRDNVAEVIAEAEKVSPRAADLTQLLVEGHLYLNQYDRAEFFAQELVSQTPDSLDAHLKLAETRLMLGKDEAVKQSLAAVKAKFPDAPAVDQLLGRLYLQRQNFDRAIESLSPLVESNPDNTEARLMLARAYASLAMMDEAIEQIDAVLEKRPDDMVAHAMAARIYQFMRQPNEANKHLEQIDERRVDERTNSALAAQLRLRKGTPEDLDAAASIAHRALAAGNTDPVLRLVLSEVYARRNEPALLEENLLSLARMQPDNGQVYLAIARFYLDQKQVDAGLQKLATLESGSQTMSRLAQARLLTQVGRRNEAMDRLTPLLEPLIRTKSRRALTIADEIARLHLSRKDSAAAAAVYDKLIAADFMTPDAKLRKIEIASSQDGVEATAGKLDELAATLTPEQSALRYKLIRRYALLGRLDRSVELLDQWIAARPEEPVLQVWKSEALMQMGKPAEAEAALAVAVEKAPDSVDHRLRLARAHAAQFDYPAAEAVLRDAAKMDSGARLVALATLGQMYQKLSLNRQALATFQELEEAGNSQDPRVLHAIGAAYFKLGRDDAALQRLSQIPPYAPQYAAAQIMIARLEQRAGKVDDAQKRLRELGQNPRFSAAAAGELLALNLNDQRDEELVKWSDEILVVDKLSPESRDAWLRLRARIMARQRNWNGVLSAVEQLGRLAPENVSVAALRAVLLDRLGRHEEGVAIYRDTEALRKSEYGHLVASVLKEPADPEIKPTGLIEFVAAMSRSDIAAAKSAIERVGAFKTVFRGDLVAIVERPDAGAETMASAFRETAAALIALDAGVPQLAEEMARGVVERAPYVAPAQGVLVQSLIDRGEPVEPALRSIRDSMPGSALALLVTAQSQADQKDFAAAAKTLGELLQREPANPHVAYQRAQRLQQAGQMAEAIEALQPIAEGQSAYRIAAANDRAFLLAEHQPGSLDEARRLAQAALAEAPHFAALIETVGWIEHLRGNDAAALEHLNRAAGVLGSLPEVQYHLGVTYKNLGNLAWSRYYLEEAAASPDPKAAEAAKKALAAR